MIRIIKYKDCRSNKRIIGDFIVEIEKTASGLKFSLKGNVSKDIELIIDEENAEEKPGIIKEDQIFEVQQEIIFDYEVYKGTCQEIFVQDIWSKNELFVKPVYGSINNKSLKERTNVKCQIARIVFNEDCSEVIIFFITKVNNVLGFENIEVDIKENTTTGYLEEYSSYFKAKMNKYKNKVEMLSYTDLYNSVTYLESQVDALTRVICALHPEHDVVKNILCAADKLSVLDIKTKEKILEEFSSDKAKIRQLQQQYYAEKTNT